MTTVCPSQRPLPGDSNAATAQDGHIDGTSESASIASDSSDEPKYLLFHVDHTTFEVPCDMGGAAKLLDVLRARVKSYRSEHQAVIDRLEEYMEYMNMLQTQLDLLDHRMTVAQGDVRRAETTLNSMGLLLATMAEA
ncbi:hypothetical protein HMN09_00557800 [Mycena chlorophos]|uniref:Uncharacterized protein n=1 Tax=Mycena chlorophos TaxID=658473 RepID=A0A8H6T8T7_MYCCL|nr:hypothetical protein HMN09_00557800 [Mycena chlorophos]